MAIDPDFGHLQQVVEGLTEYAVIFRYPEEWSRRKRSECAAVEQDLPRMEPQGRTFPGVPGQPVSSGHGPHQAGLNSLRLGVLASRCTSEPLGRIT